MAYLKIPPSFIPNSIAKLVSKLEVELNTRVQAEAGNIIDLIRSEGCKAVDPRMVQKVKQLGSGVQKIQSRVTKLKKIPEVILIPIKILEAIAKVILSLPVPQSPTPIPGLPISVTNKLTELIIITFEFIAQKKEDAESIVSILDGPSIRLQFVSGILNRATSVLGVCRVERELQKKLDDGTLTFEQLFKLGLINEDGNLVTSDLTRQYIGIDEGQSVADLANEFGITNEQVVARLQEGKKDGSTVGDIFNNDQSNIDNQLSGLLNKLDGLDLDIVGEIQSGLQQLSSIPISTDLDSRFFHSGPNGTVYKLEIRTDEKSPKVAPRRYGVALDDENVVVLSGPKSFASDTDILLNEIKFRIDNQLP